MMEKKIFQYKLHACLKKFKDCSAVEYGDRAVTYSELDRKSDNLAGWLLGKGIGRETFIGILVSDRAALISAIIAVLKAGCVFVPLDPANPVDRLEQMIDGIDLGIVLVGRDDYNTYADGLMEKATADFVILEDLFEKSQKPFSFGEEDIEYTPEDKIYIYFTSGTTGKPKAIVGKNKSLLHFIEWEIDTFGIGERFRVSQFAAPGFDAFLKDVFVPLAAGGVVCIPQNADLRLRAGELVQWVDRHRVRLIHCVPSLFRQFASTTLLPVNFKTLKYVLLAGETISPSDITGWYETYGDRVRLVNLYGPTETTLITTCYFIEPADVDLKRIPVGKPIRGSRVVILDSNMDVCNKGVAGEIYIRTPYRSFGYYNDPRLNRERFIPNPFNTDPKDIIYKTGDLGRILRDGNIEFLGRIDRQVKFHGVRLELEEIENILIEHPSVKEAAVIKHEFSEGNREILAAFVTERQPGTGDRKSLTGCLDRHMSLKLPLYITVAKLEIIEKIPMKPNGKVDYDKLPGLLKDREAAYIPPAGYTEKKLSEIWSAILGTRKIGIIDNFFRLGGSSLNVMALISKIHREFDIKVSPGEMFRNPTIEKQAKIIDKSIKNTYSGICLEEKKEYYQLSHAQKRVWTLSQFEEASLTFNMPGVFMVKGTLDKDAFVKVFEKLVERHESLRTIFITAAGEPKQKILAPGKTGFKMDYIDLKENRDQDAEIRRLADSELATPFSLSAGPLLRATLAQLEETKYVFLFTMHHIISDALSMAVLFRDVLALYRGFKEWDASSLSPLRIQYKDYAAWQNRQLNGEGMEAHRHYWKEQLKGPLPLLDLPADKPRSQLQTYDGEIVTFHIDETVTGRLTALAERHEATLFMTLLTVLKVLFYRYTDQRDIIIGTPAAGREHVELDGQVGFYINTLALRTRLDADETVGTLLEKAKKVSLEAFEHQVYPFDRLLDDLGIERDISRHPIFDVVLDMITVNRDENALEENNLEIQPLTFGYDKSKFDLTVYVYEQKEFLDIKFEYNVDLFEKNTIRRMVDHFQTLVGSIVENPSSAISDLPLDEALDFPPIVSAAPGETGPPASYHQERLWFIDKFETGKLYEDNPLYHNVPLILEITGPLDTRRMEHSIRETVNRHDALRTRVVPSGNKPVQLITPGVEIRLEAAEAVGSPLALALEEAKRPISMDGQSLFRVGLIPVEKEKFLLVFTLHHIITDKYSLELLVREVFAHYEAASGNTSMLLPAVSLQYGDFSRWQQEMPQNLTESLLFYWKRKLGGGLQPLELPTGRPRAAIHIYEDAAIPFTLSPMLSGKIRNLCREEGVDGLRVLLAAFKALLQRYSGQDEIVVGISAQDRHQPGTQKIFGPLANLLPLRSRFNGNTYFHKILSKLDKTITDAYTYRDIPFDKLVLELNPGKDMSRTALFDVLFQYEESPLKHLRAEGLDVEIIETNRGWGKYDLNMLIQSVDGESFSGVLVYNSLYYDVSTISRLIGHYKVILNDIPGRLHQPVSSLTILSEEERRQLLIGWNDTQASYPGDTAIHKLFEQEAAKMPHRAAVVFEDLVLTYGELNHQANVLARHLKNDRGVRCTDLVGIMLERSEKMITGLLGILKAGAAYIPIDPQYPRKRVDYILEDSQCRVLVTAVPDACTALEGNLKNENSPGDTAYVIYTSGTTGRPKGCMISHRNVVRLLRNDKQPFHFDGNDTWIMAHSFCFDFSVWEMYGALLNGGKLIVPSWKTVRDVTAFHAVVKKHKVSVLNQTPGAFYRFIEEEKKSQLNHLDSHLRMVILGGDKLEPGYLKEWVYIYPLRDIKLVNMYGITETTVHVSWYPLEEKDIESPYPTSPIGRPLPETTIYLLDEHLNLQPVGIKGEFYVGGSGLAVGYLNNPHVTARRFMENPHIEGQLMYKTGDIGKRLTDGDIEYLGRSDGQVKIRGYRVELGEIENGVLSYPSVNEAVVLARKDKDKNNYLTAYFTAVGEPEVNALRTYLKEIMPGYMVPAYFVQLDKFPLTANGKIDKKALPELDGYLSPAVEYEAPRNRVEEMLVTVWKDVLGVNRIGIKDNFFELGGHSLKAGILTSRMQKELNVDVPLKEIFVRPTVKELSDYIINTRKEFHSPVRPVERKEFYPLSSAQERLFIINRFYKDSVAYNMPAVYHIDGKLKKKHIEKIFEKFIQRHESLRTRFLIVDGNPFQQILDAADVEFHLQYYDLPAGVNLQDEVDNIIRNFIRPFDFSQAPLFRAGLIESGPEQYELMVDMHHIISDGTSMGILVKEFIGIYTGKELPPLKLQYKDYAQWQRFSGRGKIEQQEIYWLKKFEGNIPHINLPTDYQRPETNSFRGDVVKIMLEKGLCLRLYRLAEETGATLYMTLLAVYNILLSKYTGREDIIVGTGIAGRKHADLENIIGMFVNMLPMRNRPVNSKRFIQFLEEVKENSLEAFENQGCQFDQLVKKLGLQGSFGRNPLFDVVFQFNNLDIEIENGSFKVGDINLTAYDFKFQQCHFDLLLDAEKNNDTLRFLLTYSTDLYEKTTIQRTLDHFVRILEQVVDNKNIRLEDIVVPYESLDLKENIFKDEEVNFEF